MPYSTSNWRVPPDPVNNAEIAAEYSADVIVVGAGHSGSCAARAAAEQGASVICLEQMSRERFNVFGRDVGHINSKWLASRGVPKVDPIEFYNEWMRRSLNMCNNKLIMKFAATSGEAFDWFCEPFTEEEKSQIDVGFWPLGSRFTGDITGYKFWPGTAQFAEPREKGPDCFSMTRAVVRNHEQSEKNGAQFHFETYAEYPLLDGERVVGLIARTRDGKYVRYNASRSVVLAAGGFGGNKEMREELLPDINDMMDEGDRWMSMDHDGRGIQMGVWAGGRLEPRPLSAMGGNFLSHVSTFETFGPLWLDGKGNRFCNEMFGDTVFTGNANALSKAGKYTIVYDSKIFDDAQASPPAHMAYACNNPGYDTRARAALEAAVAAGPKGHDKGRGEIVYAADSLPELADRLGYEGEDKANFLASVERYNEMARNGRDVDFGKDPRVLFTIDTPPYFGEISARRTIGMLMVTTGGLLTDENQRVLNAKKEPIPGLFATGNCCGRRFGPQYSTPISGVSIGICYALGRLAGIEAAK